MFIASRGVYALFIELRRLRLELVGPSASIHVHSRDEPETRLDSTRHRTHLVAGLGLLEPLGGLAVRDVRSGGVVRVRAGTLEPAVLPWLGDEVGRVVGLGGVGEDAEFYGGVSASGWQRTDREAKTWGIVDGSWPSSGLCILQDAEQDMDGGVV